MRRVRLYYLIEKGRDETEKIYATLIVETNEQISRFVKSIRNSVAGEHGPLWTLLSDEEVILPICLDNSNLWGDDPRERYIYKI